MYHSWGLPLIRTLNRFTEKRFLQQLLSNNLLYNTALFRGWSTMLYFPHYNYFLQLARAPFPTSFHTFDRKGLFPHAPLPLCWGFLPRGGRS